MVLELGPRRAISLNGGDLSTLFRLSNLRMGYVVYGHPPEELPMAVLSDERIVVMSSVEDRGFLVSARHRKRPARPCRSPVTVHLDHEIGQQVVCGARYAPRRRAQVLLH